MSISLRNCSHLQLRTRIVDFVKMLTIGSFVLWKYIKKGVKIIYRVKCFCVPNSKQAERNQNNFKENLHIYLFIESAPHSLHTPDHSEPMFQFWMFVSYQGDHDSVGNAFIIYSVLTSGNTVLRVRKAVPRIAYFTRYKTHNIWNRK